MPATIALAMGCALICAWGATGIAVRYAGRWGLVDEPDARKSHDQPVPRVGGIGLLVGLLAGAFVARGAGAGLEPDCVPWDAYLVPCMLFFFIGLLDDRGLLRTRAKFGAQAVVAAIPVFLGLEWSGDAIGPFGALDFGVEATPFMTWLWIFAVVTLINFMDGIDLITASVCVVLLGVGAGGGTGPSSGGLYAVTAAALTGMAFWNVSPARVFPGDAATHVLGFLAATLALRYQGGSVQPASLPWALASAPLLICVGDVAGGLWDKLRNGVSLTQAHNNHLHQRLTKAGASHVAVALRYGLLSLTAVAVILVSNRLGLAATCGVAFLVIVAHVAQARRATRDVPLVFRTGTPPEAAESR